MDRRLRGQARTARCRLALTPNRIRRYYDFEPIDTDIQYLMHICIVPSDEKDDIVPPPVPIYPDASNDNGGVSTNKPPKT